jgi:hypothetical protein
VLSHRVLGLSRSRELGQGSAHLVTHLLPLAHAATHDAVDCIGKRGSRRRDVCRVRYKERALREFGLDAARVLTSFSRSLNVVRRPICADQADRHSSLSVRYRESWRSVEGRQEAVVPAPTTATRSALGYTKDNGLNHERARWQWHRDKANRKRVSPSRRHPGFAIAHGDRDRRGRTAGIRVRPTAERASFLGSAARRIDKHAAF